MHAIRNVFRARATRVALTLALTASCVLTASCKEHKGPTKAQKAQAKLTKDQELLALPYPKSSGTLPKSITITYDPATDRSVMTLQLAGLRTAGPSGSGVSSITLHLSSSYKGRVRAADNPEGTIDGRAVATCNAPGLLSYAGAPGAIVIGSERRELKAGSGKGGYSSSKAGAGWEESVTFRVPTADLVAATNAGTFVLSIGSVEIEIANVALADAREFVARLNPQP